jgi:hypothetical protein
MKLGIGSCCSLLVAAVALGEETIDYDAVNRIRDEGFHRSRVLEIAETLTETIGPRLTGSPQMLRANEWTRNELTEFGLANAHLEGFEFGRGWSFTRATLHMVAPLTAPLLALPKAWTPGTSGPGRGEAMRVEIESEADFEKYRGTLAGKFLFLENARKLEEPKEPVFRRSSPEELAELAMYDTDGRSRGENFREEHLKRFRLRKPLAEFLVSEKAAATFEISSRDHGLVRVTGSGSYDPTEAPGVPEIVVASEHYNRVLRMLENEKRVELELEVESTFHDSDTKAYNTVAEIPGTDLASEIVMVGAHLDSWHGGSGASDNAAGTAVVMEAVRILLAVGVKPRRTVRVALWSGEEQGLRGSRAYVAEHFASRPEPEDPEQRKLPSFLRSETGPLSLRPDHAKIAAYFNLDNGSGKIRGIYAQENAAVMPIFEAWLEPFHDLGASTVSPRTTGGTDHLAFDAVGLPGFQFIQDGLDYGTRTHHTNVDVVDHLVKEDLMQASVIMASFVYHAAMREEKLPRKPLPAPPPQ